MIFADEVLALVLSIATLFLIALHRRILARLPSPRLFVGVYLIFFAGWSATVLEGFFWEDALNVLEHTSYAVGSVLMALWCWRALRGSEELS